MNKNLNRYQGNSIDIIHKKFFHTSNYIKSKSKISKTSMDMISSSGYNNIEKFNEHRKLFDLCLKDIPISYLQFIGVDFKVLKFCIELDLENYNREIELLNLPNHFYINLVAGLRRLVELPRFDSEEIVLSYVYKFMIEHSIPLCSIIYEELKTIFIYENGNLEKRYYSPSLKFGNDKLQFKKYVSIITNIKDERINNSSI